MIVFTCQRKHGSWEVLRDGRLVCYFKDLEMARDAAASWASNIQAQGLQASVIVREKESTGRERPLKLFRRPGLPASRIIIVEDTVSRRRNTQSIRAGSHGDQAVR